MRKGKKKERKILKHALIRLLHFIVNPAFCMRTQWAVSKSKGSCLEIGCNIGHMTEKLLYNKKVSHVIAIDIDKKLLKIFKDRFRQQKREISLVLADAAYLPFREKAVDTVLLIDVLEHLIKPIKALQEAYRVASTKILINVPNYDFLNVLYPNLVPEHYKEPTHVHSTNIRTLKEWLKYIRFTRITMFGSYVPLPLPLIPLSYFLEYFFKMFQVSPTRFHFQISCEVIL